MLCSVTVPLKANINLNIIKALSSYRTVNTSSLQYRCLPDDRNMTVRIVKMINILGGQNEEFYYSNSWYTQLPQGFKPLKHCGRYMYHQFNIQ